MKTCLSILLCFVCCFHCQNLARAQSIQGQVSDWLAKDEGIDKVIVRVFRQDNNVKIGEQLTDSDGKYRIDALPINVSMRVLFEKDNYIAHPVTWITSFSKVGAIVHNEQLMKLGTGVRDGMKIDPDQIALYLKKKAPPSEGRTSYYSEQWNELRKCDLGAGVMNAIASALVKHDPAAAKDSAIYSASH